MTVAVLGDFSSYDVALEFGIRLAKLTSEHPLLLNLGSTLHHEYHASYSGIAHQLIQQLPPAKHLVTAETITAVIGNRIAEPLAEQWGVLWVPTDSLSEQIPRAATHPTRPQRICICGPESCGKSTLTKQLADSLDGFPVMEYARLFYEAVKREPLYQDLLFVGCGQAVLEDLCAESNAPLLVCDTDALTTVIWSTFLFGRVDARLQNYARYRASHYSSYLLLDIDLPWIADGVRYLPKDRGTFLAACRSILDAAGVPYHLVSGQNQARLQAGLAALGKHEECCRV